MRTQDWIAIAALGIAATGFAWQSSRGRAEESSSVTSPSLVVGDALRIDTSPITLLPMGQGKHEIRFAVPPGERLVGLCTATICAAEESKPALHRSMDLSILQGEGGFLDMGPWLARLRPEGPHFLRFCLVLQGPGGLRYRAGWARVNAFDLLETGVVVHPRESSLTTIRVRSAMGQAVPGATVVVSLFPFPHGAASILVATDAEGIAVVDGLEDGREWTVELPHGVGPETQPIRASFASPCALVPLEVALEGNWEFRPFVLRRQALGQGAALEAVRGPADERLAVWSVSSFLIPGTGRDSVHFLALRTGTELPETLAACFRGGPPVPLTLTGGTRSVSLPWSPTAGDLRSRMTR